MSDTKWFVGQQVAIDRREIDTILHITRMGRVIVGDCVYDPDGFQLLETRVSFVPKKIEPLTPEIKAKIDYDARIEAAYDMFKAAKETADIWVDDRFCLPSYNRKPPNVADVEKVERLAAAITGVLGEST